jgi:hypothetical protein
MVAERLTTFVAVEQRGEHLERERGRDEERVALKRGHDHLADLLGNRMIFGKLLVVLGFRRLVAGGDATVDPMSRGKKLARLRNLLRTEDVWDLEEHVKT